MNIWELDFYDNPLVPLLAKLNELYKRKGKALPVRIINSMGDLASKSLISLCEIGVRKTIGSETIDVIKDKFSSGYLYDDFKMYEDSLKELKQTLIKWAEEK